MSRIRKDARRAALGLGAAMLAGCTASIGVPAPPPLPEFTTIATAGQFLEKVAGEPMTFPNGTVMTAQPDGSLAGATPSGPLAGSWDFTGGQFCRTAVVAGAPAPRLCNVIEASDEALRFINPDGTLFADAALGGG